ncbi:MAG: polysaccharide deacetylase family protein [Saprospiraceae bacterium]|nr:polysaccharide deacetylase family protein [Saprospiraceae bacterium]
MLTVQTSEQYRPEKEYALHILLKEMLGIDYRIEYQDSDGHAIRLPTGGLLHFEDWFSTLYSADTDAFRTRFSESWLPNPQIPKPPDPQIPDLFAATFFMLTRIEESNSPEQDHHGRFPAEHALAWQLGFLHRPVVNEWADWLWESLHRHGWSAERKSRTFQLSVSCDVDHPRLWWSVADRVKTIAGAIFKRRDLNEAGYWLKSYFFQKKDPYDVFDEWLVLFEKNNLRAQFNFMGERPRSSDCWYPLKHPFVRNLMGKIAARGHTIGFHPSYEAFENQQIFEHELSSLRSISPLEITTGRQHYLRFAAPETWQMWENAGLKEDSTLGYPEAEGFRCGICHDFPVFDTIQRKMLNLREKPLIAMDVTLAQYRHYTPEQAAECLLQLRRTVEKHGGDFTLLWHNSSWNSPFWEAWKPVFLSMLVRNKF